jgi:hypothetical protein
MNDLPTLRDEAAPENVAPSETVRHLAYAEAAVMLLECLMLKLIERQIFTAAEMVGTVEDAIATKRQMVTDGEHPQISAVASGLLRTMANSLAASKAARRG